MIPQRRLGLRFDAPADAMAEAVRQFQQGHGLLVTGVLDPETELALDRIPTFDLVPWWFGKPWQNEVVTSRLGDEDGVRRFQSAVGLEPTGVVDELTARRMGD